MSATTQILDDSLNLMTVIGMDFAISNLITHILANSDELDESTTRDGYSVFFHENNNTVTLFNF